MNELYVKLVLGIYFLILVSSLVVFLVSPRDTEARRTAGRALLVCVLLAAFPLMVLWELLKQTK